MKKLITELGYLGFEVADLTRWEQFAGDVLGLGVTAGTVPNTLLLRMDEQRARFILQQGPADDVIFTGWRVRNNAAVEAFGQHLNGNGLAWSWANDDELSLRCVERMLHFKDPQGNRHEVFYGPQLVSNRFASPKVASGFVTTNEGLGHAVYSSSEYAGTLEFAQKILGFALSDQILLQFGPSMTFEVSFFHANARHHSFAIAPRPPTPGPHKSLHHFMIEVNSVEEVGFARDRCLAMGQAVHMDIGQHPNDRMISFYGQTPSGFYVEFGWGGVKVNPDTWQTVTYDKLSEWGHRPSSEVAPRSSASVTISSSKEIPMSVHGSWNVVIKTPMGDNSVVFNLEVDGATLEGSVKGPTETNEISGGKIDGNTLTWNSKVSVPMPMDIEFTATVDGDNISGGAKSPFGTAPFSGTRA